MKDKLTKKEIKEFWEWCGLKVQNAPSGRYFIVTYPDGSSSMDAGFVRYPPLDLNNLFKYAVPKLDSYNRTQILLAWAYEVVDVKLNPAAALFKAIQEVIKNEGG